MTWRTASSRVSASHAASAGTGGRGAQSPHCVVVSADGSAPEGARGETTATRHPVALGKTAERKETSATEAGRGEVANRRA